MTVNDPVELRQVSAQAPEIARLLDASAALMAALYPAESNHYLSAAELDTAGCFVIGAYDQDEAVGCGATRIIAGLGYGEIKAVFVAETHRRRRIAGRILQALESHLIAHSIGIARLETGNRQPEAIALYRGSGYIEIPPFGPYSADPNSVFMEKHVAR